MCCGDSVYDLDIRPIAEQHVRQRLARPQTESAVHDAMLRVYCSTSHARHNLGLHGPKRETNSTTSLQRTSHCRLRVRQCMQTRLSPVAEQLKTQSDITLFDLCFIP